MTEAWVYFLCGMLTMMPLATWFGIQIGRERQLQELLDDEVAVPPV